MNTSVNTEKLYQKKNYKKTTYIKNKNSKFELTAGEHSRF